jgi:hypothetical protein
VGSRKTETKKQINRAKEESSSVPVLVSILVPVLVPVLVLVLVPILVSGLD